MITLITGLPGAGKTLYTLQAVEELRLKSIADGTERPVFYSGIKELALPWTEFDAETWFDLPVGAIIVIDECQRVFRPRAHGKNPPKHVSELETHRHEGFDIFLTTQHPSLCDVAVRRLSGAHYHVMRAFGMHKAMIHEWAGVNTRCEEPGARESSIKHPWSYPSKLFKAYHSAEIHTHKRRLPARLLLLVVLPLGAIAAGVFFVRHMDPSRMADSMKGKVVREAEAKSGVGGVTGGAAAPVSPVKVRDIVKEWTPRIPDFPETAPMFDALTTVKTIPSVKACVKSVKRCSCYSEQGTLLEVSPARCDAFVAHASFDPYKEPYRSVDALPSRGRPSEDVPVRASPVPQAESGAASQGGRRFAAMGYTVGR